MKPITITKYSSGERYISGLLPEDIAVIIDNGHGTRAFTDGKCSSDHRYYEGEWSRKMSRKLAKALEELGFATWLVVPEDEDVGLVERCERANSWARAHRSKYCIYVSIHSDADRYENLVNGWSGARGMGVHVGLNASEASKVLATNIYNAGMAMGLKGNRKSNSYKVSNFTVLTGTNMPAVLTESAFHTNKEDVDYLLSDKGQEDIVNYHLAGICKTFGIPYSIVKG